MKVSHHGASVGIIEKVDHRAMAAGTTQHYMIEAGCDDLRYSS